MLLLTPTLHPMSLSDNLRRLARERIPTAPVKWLGPITPTVYTNDSTLTETKAFDWGFFDPATVPHLQIKIEDEDEFDDNLA
jgi:hypothetical protein